VAAEGRPPGEPDPDSKTGRMLRPEFSVLGDEALVPERNVIRPPPNRFTHELLADEPYRLDRSEDAGEPDGVLPAGTPVVLLVEGPDSCRVVDGDGLYVEVRRESLRKLPDA
jgi:hypothetical protein